jgi:hypothetical protein
MSRSHSRVLAAAVLLSAVVGTSNFAAAVDEPNPKPPADQTATPPVDPTTTPPPAQTTTPTTDQTATPPVTPQPIAAPQKAKKKTQRTPESTTAQRNSSAKDFLDGYHAAHALIYDHGDFEGGIAALRALGHDENADVATLIGYASRKLGRYGDAQYWYEHALAADPNHAVTWSYYGMWQAEQGNILKARDDLEKVRLICGNTECRAYTMLKEVIDGTRTY